MRRNILFALSLLVAIVATATTFTGRIIDETGEPVAFANVVILNPDSAYISGATTDADGIFSVDCHHDCAIVKVSYLGYQTYRRNLTKERGRGLSLGDIRLEPDAVQLDEAIVTAQVPKMVIKDDTVVYNADAFSVPEGSVIEALVEFFSGMAKANSPHRPGFVGAYIFAAGCYIFFSTVFDTKTSPLPKRSP